MWPVYPNVEAGLVGVHDVASGQTANDSASSITDGVNSGYSIKVAQPGFSTIKLIILPVVSKCLWEDTFCLLTYIYMNSWFPIVVSDYHIMHDYRLFICYYFLIYVQSP